MQVDTAVGKREACCFGELVIIINMLYSIGLYMKKTAGTKFEIVLTKREVTTDSQWVSIFYNKFLYQSQVGLHVGLQAIDTLTNLQKFGKSRQ